MEKEVYLRTKPTSSTGTESFFRVNDKCILTINLRNKSIKETKAVTSSPHKLIPSDKEEFEAARSRVINHLERL